MQVVQIITHIDHITHKDPSLRWEGWSQASSFRTLYSQPQMESLQWLQVQVIASRVWKGHLWGAAWRQRLRSLHMAMFLTISWSLRSSFSSSSSPKFLSPSFSAFFSFSFFPFLSSLL